MSKPTSPPPNPARLSLLCDAGPTDTLLTLRGEAQDSWVCKVAGLDGHQAIYSFVDGGRDVWLDMLAVPDGRTGYGRKKWARLMDGWSLCGYERCLIWRAAGNAKSKSWSGYYVWPRFGFDGKMTRGQHKRLPSSYRGSLDLQTLFAKPGGRDVWKRFGGVVHDLTFDLRPGSKNRLLFQDS